MMIKRTSALAGIFDDEPAQDLSPTRAAELEPEAQSESAPRGLRRSASAQSSRRNSHPGKKPVLIHIPEDMHRVLRQLSVEEGGEPLTVITERKLREYLVERGHARFAPAKPSSN